MVTVLRRGGFEVVIYSNDHRPPHVHVFAAGGELKVELDDGSGQVKLIWAYRLSAKDIRRAVALVSAERDMVLRRWRAMHG